MEQLPSVRNTVILFAALTMATSAIRGATITITTADGNGADATVTGLQSIDESDRNHGWRDQLSVRHYSNRHEKSWLRFELPDDIEKITDARLDLYWNQSWPVMIGFEVFGLNETSDYGTNDITGEERLREDWPENLLTWNNAPGNDDSPHSNEFNSLLAGSLYQFHSTRDHALGTVSMPTAESVFPPHWTESEAQTNARVETASRNLIGFLNSDTNDMVTFMVRRPPGGDCMQCVGYFATKEHTDPTKHPPRLVLEYQPGVPAVLDRHVFYNNSRFDDANDNAIATDKTPLIPGEPATFDNYTSYDLGINGIMVDIDYLANPDSLDIETIGNYFQFRAGNDENPDGWDEAPDIRQVTVRENDGVDGSDRVTITWPDYAIQNEWLQVTVAANEFTGLEEEDVFYFGNAVGEAGNSDTDTLVTVTDLLLARNNTRNFLDPAGIDYPYDYNRDQRVNTTDLLLARNNTTNFLTSLRLITAPGKAGVTGKAGATVVPEPGTGALLALGVVGLAVCAWRRRRKGAPVDDLDARAGQWGTGSGRSGSLVGDSSRWQP